MVVMVMQFVSRSFFIVFVTGYPRRIFWYPVPVPVISRPREAGTRPFWSP